MDVRAPVPDDVRSDRRWARALLATVGLLVASLVPSPFEWRPDWRCVGPDKVLHLVGQAADGRLLAGALGSGPTRARTAAPVALCLSTAHGVLSGRLQERVPGRVRARGRGVGVRRVRPRRALVGTRRRSGGALTGGRAVGRALGVRPRSGPGFGSTVVVRATAVTTPRA